MKQALEYAVDKEIIEESPLAKAKIDGKRLFQKVKKQPSETQVFTKEEHKAFNELAWKDFYNRTKTYELAPLAVMFQFQTGVRLGEVCTLRYEDLERSDYIHVQRMFRQCTKEVVEHTKTEYGDREIFLTNAAKDLIEKAHERQLDLGVESDGYIFSINGKPLSYDATRKLYVKYCDKANITYRSSHKARKTFISALIDGNVNIDTIRKMAGHADERTTYGSYVFDRSIEAEKKNKIENALAT